MGKEVVASSACVWGAYTPPSPADPEPSTIAVGGLTGAVSKVNAQPLSAGIKRHPGRNEK